MQTSDYNCVKTTKIQTGLYYNIWLEDGLVELSSIKTFIQKMEILVTYLAMISNFGKPFDVDANGRTDIIISNKIDNASNDSLSYVSGYVSPNDYFKNSENLNNSNEKDIIYLNYKLASSSLSNFVSTAIHELQHLIRVSHQVDLVKNEYIADAYWINEGTSEYASDIAGYGPQSVRIDCFNSSDNCPTGGVNGISLFIKPNLVYKNRSSLNNYAFFYTFLTFLYMAAGNTDKERQIFVHKITTGFDPEGKEQAKDIVRAKNIKTLMSAFKKHATTYKKELLGDNEEIIFSRLYSTFLLGASRDKVDNINVTESDQNGTNVTQSTVYKKLLTTYKIPDTFIQTDGSKKDYLKSIRYYPSSYKNSYINLGLKAGTNLYFKYPTSNETNIKNYRAKKYETVINNVEYISSGSSDTTTKGVVKINYSFTHNVDKEKMMPNLTGTEAKESFFSINQHVKNKQKKGHICVQNLLSIKMGIEQKKSKKL